MQVITAVSAEDFGAWEAAGFAPEAKFLDALKVYSPPSLRCQESKMVTSSAKAWADRGCMRLQAVSGLQRVETQTFTLMTM